jgi:hypothetical protein
MFYAVYVYSVAIFTKIKDDNFSCFIILGGYCLVIMDKISHVTGRYVHGKGCHCVSRIVLFLHKYNHILDPSIVC